MRQAEVYRFLTGEYVAGRVESATGEFDRFRFQRLLMRRRVSDIPNDAPVFEGSFLEFEQWSQVDNDFGPRAKQEDPVALTISWMTAVLLQDKSIVAFQYRGPLFQRPQKNQMPANLIKAGVAIREVAINIENDHALTMITIREIIRKLCPIFPFCK